MVDIIDELWKLIPQAPDYEVSSHGRVRRRTKSGRRPPPTGFIAWRLKRGPYYEVRLIPERNAKPVAFKIHRLVAEAFCPKPEAGEKLVVAHWDGKNFNNHASNLRWATVKQNAADAGRHGTLTIGHRNAQCKLSDDDVVDIRWLLYEGAVRKIIAKSYGVSRGLIDGIAAGRMRTRRTPTPIETRAVAIRKLAEVGMKTPPLVA